MPTVNGESFTLVPRIKNPNASSKPSQPMTEEWHNVDSEAVE
ncbi:hypothetical protein [Lactiplantibacillus daowaiensis]|uniref:Uncharacterized protein n=1 Tax=Lactiplantibacillus daowaiensis TaxID=2559918 RepID=A0ABW1RXJ1_9LACO|nr:hypothetical protein [Lactiplantibacillus daowaiensis]